MEIIMSATIVPFNKNKIPCNKKQIKDAEGEDLIPPTKDDIVGFLNVINFLALQSSTNSVDISVLIDELNISIKHHDNVYEEGDLSACTSFEIMTSIPYDIESQDKEKTIANLLAMFDRLDVDKYEDE
jgi:hypothetical protein